jgi:hypothetical protein
VSKKQKLSDVIAFRISIVVIMIGMFLGFAAFGIIAHDETEEEDQLVIPPSRPASEMAFVNSVAACAAPSPVPQSCGVERWSVKTGTDSTIGSVNLLSATPTTVAGLHAFPSPNPTPANSRVAPGETTQWVINGTLLEYKLESDSDYHLVVQDGSGNTIVTEIPYPGASPACVPASSAFLAGIAGARCKFDGSGLAPATTFFQTANVPVRVVGVGMFDFPHGQTGASPNQMEIHAILDIAFPKTVNAATGTGSNVNVQTGDAALTFSAVTAAGTTTAIPVDPATTGTAPANQMLVGPALNFSSTAAFAAPVSICISVPYITDAAAFGKLNILHLESGTLVNRTTFVNPAQKTVCGNLPSLSQVVVSLGTVASPTNALHRQFDFDGDGKTDASVFRPSTGDWYLLGSTAGFSALHFGAPSDILVPADYTGDGKTDVAVFRPSSGIWYILRSEDNTFYGLVFGIDGDIPAPADYDGDGKADLAVYRPGAQGFWYLQQTTAGFTSVPFGVAEDKPAIGDFDGDGKADISVYRPSLGNWYRLNSSDQSFYGVHFGSPGDMIVPGDYNGDGKTDVAIFRPSTSIWYILPSGATTFYGVGFGTTGDIPAPGDYDGDGKTDIAVYRPGPQSVFYVQQSTAGFNAIPWGLSEDRPTANAFVF